MLLLKYIEVHLYIYNIDIHLYVKHQNEIRLNRAGSIRYLR